MSAQDNARIARAIYDAFNDRDFDQGVSLVAKDVRWLNVPLGITFQGPAGYRQYVQGWAAAFPDSKVEITNMIASEEGVVTEFRGRGTHTGPLAGPAGEIPATGRRVDVSFCDVLRFQNGKIVSAHTYYDAATLMRQLGLTS
jgi:steroid delta-isomerase-like uncharacterized protein